MKHDFYVLFTVHLDTGIVKSKLMHFLSSVYFVSQPLYVPGMFVAHHREVYYIYIYIHTQNSLYVFCF